MFTRLERLPEKFPLFYFKFSLYKYNLRLIRIPVAFMAGCLCNPIVETMANYFYLVFVLLAIVVTTLPQGKQCR